MSISLIAWPPKVPVQKLVPLGSRFKANRPPIPGLYVWMIFPKAFKRYTLPSPDATMTSPLGRMRSANRLLDPTLEAKFGKKLLVAKSKAKMFRSSLDDRNRA
jgi:hypothetical protein